MRSGDFAGARAICRAEYDLDLAIAQAAKPVISLIDGLVMGGGIGLSCHVSHPVLTERACLALPETGIGFIPDSGINAILASGPGRLGARLALTGETIGAGDMLRAGFGRHMVRSACLPALLDALAGSGDPTALGAFAAPPPPALLAEQQAETDAAFAGADLTGILARLDRHAQGNWQKQAARLIRRNSPAACQAALNLLAAIGPEDPLETVLATEFDVVSAMLAHPDFLEGVRAHIVDRDRKPLWRVPETMTDRDI